MDGIAAIRSAAGARATRPAARAGGFRLDPAPAESAAAAAPSRAVAPTPAPPDDPAARDRRAAVRARRVLADLAAVQAGLLDGNADVAALRRLAESATAEESADPILAETLAAISLRAQVELARRGRPVAPA